MSAERGIGRYLSELLAALRGSEHGIRLSYALNPDLPITQLVEPLLASGQATPSDRLDPGAGDVFHVPSPFEPAHIDRVWPPAARGLPLVVTVHDLIPFVLSDLYLRSASERRWYRTRLELVKRAERVIAVSQATANDVVEHAGVEPGRIVVVSEGPAERFKPLPDRSAGLMAARYAIPRLREEFVFYPGGMDPRKNIARLLDAYSGLPAALRKRHQLVVTGKLTDWDRREVDRMLDHFDVTEDAFFPGHVSDEVLLLLFQSAKLTVFPSLYEGFGLPVAESIACGTPVIASDTSSLPELIEDGEALFDPHDAASIREKLRRALEDGALHERLAAARLDERHSWAGAATGTAAVYRSAGRKPRLTGRRLRRLAVVASLPQGDLARAAETYRLLAALGRRCAVDAFVAGPGGLMPPRVDRYHPARFDLIERGRAGYDAVLAILADEPGASGVLTHVLRHGGNVLLRSPSLVRLYAESARDRLEHEPGSFSDALRWIYRDDLPHEFEGFRRVSPAAVDRRGLLLAREVVRIADRVFVQSEHARRLVELDCAGTDAIKLQLLPLAYPKPHADRQERSARIVARVGNAGSAFQKLVDGFAEVARERSNVDFGIVIARRGRRLRSAVLDVVRARGIASRTSLAAEQDTAAWRRLLSRAAVVVELGDARTTMPSDFLLESLATGIPTVVSETGALREFPEGVVVGLPPGEGPDSLAGEIAALFDDQERSSSLSGRARTHAGEHSADALAESLVRALGVEASETAPVGARGAAESTV